MSFKFYTAYDAVVISDGGGDEHIGAACVVRLIAKQQRIKLLTILNSASSEDFELIAGLIGLRFIEDEQLSAPKVLWVTDRESLIIKSAKQANTTANWEKLFALKKNLTLTIEHLKAHPKLRTDHAACHKVCRWVQQSPELFSNASTNGIVAGNNNWRIVDLSYV